MKKVLSLICLVALLLLCASAIAEEKKDPLIDEESDRQAHCRGKHLSGR